MDFDGPAKMRAVFRRQASELVEQNPAFGRRDTIAAPRRLLVLAPEDVLLETGARVANAVAFRAIEIVVDDEGGAAADEAMRAGIVDDDRRSRRLGSLAIIAGVQAVLAVGG
jgi:hypothetical protein